MNARLIHFSFLEAPAARMKSYTVSQLGAIQPFTSHPSPDQIAVRRGRSPGAAPLSTSEAAAVQAALPGTPPSTSAVRAGSVSDRATVKPRCPNINQ